jgi:hypothetical protein
VAKIGGQVANGWALGLQMESREVMVELEVV